MTKREIQVLEDVYNRKIVCPVMKNGSFTSGLLSQLLDQILDDIDYKFGKKQREDIKWTRRVVLLNFIQTYNLLSNLNELNIKKITPIKLKK
jgi:hypothetical protein